MTKLETTKEIPENNKESVEQSKAKLLEKRKQLPDKVVDKKDLKVKKPKVADASSIKSIVLRESLAVARKSFGDKNICVAGEANKIVIGLPLPSLSLEYLIQNTVWPLGRFTQIVGKHGTCKSALGFEMARWFKLSQGITYLFETETKYAPDLALSILGYSANADDEAMVMIPCDSVDDWQAKLQKMTAHCQKAMESKEIGKTFPVLYMVDSLMGRLAKATQEKIETEGHADRAHPLEALMINGFMKKYPQDIEEWPMCLVATNHLKPSKTETGAIERKIAGGASPGFQETFEIEMSREANARVSLVDEENFELGGLKLRLTCKKNSLGETDRSIRADIRWYHRDDPVTGESKQYTYWDWPAATVHLLNTFEGHRKEKINEIVHIGGSGNRFYSSTFDISSTSPVSASELGKLIEQDVDIKNKLRKLFGIKERKIFQPGHDYTEQLTKLTKEVEKRLVK